MTLCGGGCGPFANFLATPSSFGKESWYSWDKMPSFVDAAEHPATRCSSDMAARDPLPQHSAETACGEGASAGVASPVRRQKRVTQTKRHPNVFLKHKLKYKKKSSTQEDSSCSSTESERSTPTSRPQPPVTCVPAATADSRCCCCSAELCQRGSTLAQSGRGSETWLPADPVGAVPLLPAAVAAPPLHSSSSVTSVQAASGDPRSSNFFNSIPSVSSSLSSASSRSLGASAEKEGSDSSDSLVSVKATQCSLEKEASDSSDSLASGASATRKSIKKLIRNKYDIFRRHKLKYRRLLGKSDRRADLPLDRAGGGSSSCSNGRDSASGSLVAARCPANDGRDDSASRCGGSSGSSSSSSSSSSSGCSSAGSAASAVGEGGHHPVTTAHLPGPRGLPHNPLLHSSSDGSRSSSSSSLQSSSSSARSSRDTGFVDKGRERERRRRRRTSPAVINRVVPLMVMMQRQTVACDAGSATLMFKCNMCNMFSTTMQNVLAHISEHHATAQYCFDCESFFPDSQSLDSHLAVGCQGGCSVSRTGSDAALPDEGSESQPSPSPSPPPSLGFCRKAAALATAGAKPLAGGAGGGRGGGGRGGSSVSSVGCLSEASPSLATRCSEGGSGVPSSCTTVERSTESRPRLLRSQSLQPQLPECPQGNERGGSADVSSHRSDPLVSLCSTASLPSGSSAPGTTESLSSSVTVASSAPSCGSSSGRHAIAEVASDAGKEHRCRLCSKEFLGLCYLKRHMRSHTGEKICFCPTCHRGFSEWRNLRNHIARFHGSGDCGSDLMAPAASRSASSDGGSCRASSASTSGLSEAQPGEPFAGSSSAGSVEEAMEDAEPLLSCSIEPTTDSTADPDADGGDPLHYSTMHLGSTSSRLELNSDETFRKKALTPHNCVGGLRRTYHCEPCSKDFVTKFAMQRHLDFHADKRPFHCDMCSYKSKTKPQLKVHQMRHKGQKVYHCDLCNYDCVTHSDLNRHCKSMSHKSRHGSSTVSSS